MMAGKGGAFQAPLSSATVGVRLRTPPDPVFRRCTSSGVVHPLRRSHFTVGDWDMADLGPADRLGTSGFLRFVSTSVWRRSRHVIRKDES